MLEKYNETLSINDIMEILNVSKNTAYDYIKSGEIPNKKVRNKYIIPKIGVENYLKNICKIY